MSLRDPVAHRYAQAVFDLCRDGGTLESAQAGLVAAANRLGNEQVRRVFESPRVERSARAGVALDLIGSVDPPVQNLVRLLVERQRIAALPQIRDAFIALADAHRGRLRAEVVSAVELSPAQRRTIAGQLGEQLGGEVDTTVIHDPAIIGGLVIRIGDRVIDGSVRTRLDELRVALA